MTSSNCLYQHLEIALQGFTVLVRMPVVAGPLQRSRVLETPRPPLDIEGVPAYREQPSCRKDYVLYVQRCSVLRVCSCTRGWSCAPVSSPPHAHPHVEHEFAMQWPHGSFMSRSRQILPIGEGLFFVTISSLTSPTLFLRTR
ncbi:hypothetical protein DPEC_G00316480 [Dallia pectoralis]|uniref:Uncharacterized protein n=1 Tax=Dallia pectoralis TaxID=75939 RepID=A0ACC2FD16_DALPE|nr:hypothetical protein DPEC_G00316480 [Dallia pectoralis]